MRTTGPLEATVATFWGLLKLCFTSRESVRERRCSMNHKDPAQGVHRIVLLRSCDIANPKKHHLALNLQLGEKEIFVSTRKSRC